MHSLAPHGTGLLLWQRLPIPQARVCRNTGLYYLYVLVSSCCLRVWGKESAGIQGGIPFSIQCGHICVAPRQGRCFSLNDAGLWGIAPDLHHLTLLQTLCQHLQTTSQWDSAFPRNGNEVLCRARAWQELVAESHPFEPPKWSTSFIKKCSPDAAICDNIRAGLLSAACYSVDTEASPGVSPPAKAWDPAEYQTPLLHIIVLAELSPELPVYLQNSEINPIKPPLTFPHSLWCSPCLFAGKRQRMGKVHQMVFLEWKPTRKRDIMRGRGGGSD